MHSQGETKTTSGAVDAVQRKAPAIMNVARVIAPVHIILALPCREQKGQNPSMKYWELVADKLSKAGWSLGWVSAVDSEGRVIWIVDAHRDNGKRFVVRSDEMLSAFLELERITHELAVSALLGDDSH
jgi:hypothetical protein